MACNAKSVVFDHFTTLSLEVPDHPSNLQHVLGNFTKSEQVEWY